MTWLEIALADKFQNGNICILLGICYTLILYGGFKQGIPFIYLALFVFCHHSGLAACMKARLYTRLLLLVAPSS